MHSLYITKSGGDDQSLDENESIIYEKAVQKGGVEVRIIRGALFGGSALTRMHVSPTSRFEVKPMRHLHFQSQNIVTY